jgi:hypothetical protein
MYCPATQKESLAHCRLVLLVFATVSYWNWVHLAAELHTRFEMLVGAIASN